MVKVNVKIPSTTVKYFEKTMPKQLEKARKDAVEAAGMVWADEAKSITRADGHIDTGLYVNSIGYVTGSPATEADVINELKERRSKTTLRTGSGVDYASHLEKRYNIMARGIDNSEKRIGKVAAEAVKRRLGL